MENQEDQLPQLLSIELMRLGGRLVSSVQGHLKRWDVSTPQFNVLRILYVRDEEKGVSCQTVIDRLLTPVPDLTRLLSGWKSADGCSGFATHMTAEFDGVN